MKTPDYVFLTKNNRPYNGKITMERAQALIILNRAMVKDPKNFKFKSVNGTITASAGTDVYKVEPITGYANQNRRYHK